MRFERHYSDGRPAREQVEWKMLDAIVEGAFEQRGVEVPATWSQDAANILASKYFRKAGVPHNIRAAPYTQTGIIPPVWLHPSEPVPGTVPGSETSAHQVFHRMAGCWTYWGWREGLFEDQSDVAITKDTAEYQARIFYDETYLMLARQVAAPNSPQWFNCFAGSEKFITKEYGSVRLDAVLEKEINVWTRDGWQNAQVRSFGVQNVQTVELTPAFQLNNGGWSTGKTNIHREIKVTSDHRWITDRGTVTDLRTGDLIYSSVVTPDESSSDYRYGFQHGVIFGDGSFHYTAEKELEGLKRFFARLIGERKRALATMFDQVYKPPFLIDDLHVVVHAHKDLKDFPDGTEPSDYLCGFLDGWIATDGSKKGTDGYRLSTVNANGEKWLVDYAAASGWFLSGHSVEPISDKPIFIRGVETQRSGEMHSFNLTKSQRAWRVTSIIDSGEEQEVFCPIVPDNHEFTLSIGAITGNCGLHWAYGITGNANGQWATDNKGTPYLTPNAYEKSQPHACFLTSIIDDLVNEGGIMDAWLREARIFKHGSGSGTNVSKLRAKGEPLSGGGVASGVMSWLRIGDRAAGAIQSGGTTRRAALLRILDMDHPEIEDFINWKVREEHKAASMYVGSKHIADGAANYTPPQVSDRIAAGFKPEVFGIGWEEEAIDTVSGQNSNNSIRPTDSFFKAVDNKEEWQLWSRTSPRRVLKVVQADYLWESTCRAAWASADPGVMFHDTINAWNTCAADGEITNSNPCCEFHHLSGHPEYGSSACNLASLKLTAFLPEQSHSIDDAMQRDDIFDYGAYQHACRLWQTVLDISISMAAFPAKEFALGAYNYRTTGLGYMDLGGLLMRLALPYDSDKARALASGLTALMTGVAYSTSAELAEALGPFPRWEANAEGMRRVLRNHARAAGVDAELSNDYEGLNIEPLGLTTEYSEDLTIAITRAWNKVLHADSFRNAQTTLLAPTGTISLVTDCDTSGVEPDFSLVKHKALAGGGSMKIVNRAVPAALRRLGYNEWVIEEVGKFIQKYGRVPEKKDFHTVYVEDKHLHVFDCAVGERSIRPMAHVEMVAAVQPFLSGAVSKTINLPADATVADVDHVYREAHRLGLKAVALYRDGCKLTQPLSVAKRDEPVDVAVSVTEIKAAKEFFEGARSNLLFATWPKGEPSELPRGTREMLPWRREDGYTQKVKIGDQSIFLTVNRYPDGRPGEMYLELSHEGSTLRALADMVAMAVSLGLQHGVPVAEYVERFCHVKFEPAGVVEGHDRIALVSSIADFIGRELGITFLDREDLAQKQATIAIGSDRIVALDKRAVGVASGYSGEICRGCGNATLKRSGSCLTCDTCGETTGCG